MDRDDGLLGRRRVLLGFLGLNALAGVSAGVAKVILSLYAVQLQADAVLLGLIAGAQSIGILAMSLPAGMLVDKYGPLRLFSIGTGISGVLYLTLSTVETAQLLCIVVMLISCFMPLRIVSLSAMFMQQISRVGVGMAGWFRATHMVGMLLLGPMLAVSLLDALGFAGAYVSIGATFFLLVLLAPGVLRHYRQTREHAREISMAELKAQLGLVRDDALLRRSCLHEFCIQAANQYYVFFIVAIAIQSFRYDAAGAAALISAQGASYVLALLGMGNLAVRMDRRVFLSVGCGVIAAALTLLGLAPAGWLLWPGAVALGLGLGMLQIVNISWFSEAGVRHGQGRIAGVTTFVGPAGGLVGSVLGGLVGHGVGLQSVFCLMAPVFVVFMLRYRGTPP